MVGVSALGRRLRVCWYWVSCGRSNWSVVWHPCLAGEAVKSQGTISRRVAEHPFLVGLKPELSEIFCQCASLRHFDEGQEIFQQGGQADHFYLIESGQVVLDIRVPGRDKVVIQALGPGEALGWSWLFPPYQWHFSAAATTATETIAFGAECLREKAKENPRVGYELVLRLAQVLAGRLDDVSMRLFYSGQRQR